MTGLRAELTLALAAGLFVAAAAAQVPAPVPKPLSDGSPVQAEPLPASELPSKPVPVQVDTLGTSDGPAVGLLDADHGGMAPDIWSGSARSEIEDLMARLPLATPVRSVRNLARRLLLTTADAPEGQAPHSFQTVRLRALLDAGLVGDAAKLASLIRLKDDPEVIEVQAHALAFGGTPAELCSDATKARDTNTEAFWLQLRAYCYGLTGQGDLFDLTRGVMRAEQADDKAFEILLDDALTQKSQPVGELHAPTAMGLFLLREAGLPISPVYSARFGMAASVLALRAAKNPPSARADAAAQVMHTGAASAAELCALADAQVFTPQQFANADAAATGLPFFLGQALIRQAVARATDDADRARLLATAFRLGRQMQLLTVAAALQEKAAAAVLPGPSLRTFAPAFARALLLAHQADAAEKWRETLDPASEADGPLAAGIAVTLNLVAPNPGRTQRAQSALGWLAQNSLSVQPAGGPQGQEIAVLALALYDALGEPLPAGVQLAPFLQRGWQGRIIPPAMRKRIEDLKGQPGRKGEVLLAVLGTIGASGPGDLTPDGAAFLVRTLKTEGEGDAARALAADALLLFEPHSQP